MPVSRSQIAQLLNRLEPPVREIFERAIRQAQSRANIAAMIKAIELGDLNALMAAAGIREGMWSQLTEEIRTAYMQAGIFVLSQDLPRRLSLDFDINNPRAEMWLRNQSSRMITGELLAEQRAAVQTVLHSGMMAGSNPRTTALDIVGRMSRTGRRTGGILGLTSSQTQYVLNAADDLVSLNARYFSRRLRDKRYDTVVRKSFSLGKPLPKKVRDKILTSYENRLLKHRGDTIARTEVLAAVNEASDEALRQMVQQGLVPQNAVKRIWRHSYSKNEREGHLRMDGEERGIDEPFTNPITGAVLLHPGEGPGSEIINCRCYLEHSIDFVAVEQAA